MATEIELKYRLTAAEFRRLRARIGKTGRTRRFINYFFDGPGRPLARRGIGLRIRRMPGKPAVLTLKFGGGVKGGLHVRRELEGSLPDGKALAYVRNRRPLGELRSGPMSRLVRLVPAEAVLGLKCLGGLATSRTTFPLGPWNGELDACRLFGIRFYELELETPRVAEGRRLVKELLGGLHIPLRPEPLSKMARFHKALKKR